MGKKILKLKMIEAMLFYILWEDDVFDILNRGWGS